MALKNLFNTMKTEGIIKLIDQHLIISYYDDPDRRSDINSPSSSLGCVRASYYARNRVPKRHPAPRLQRIFGNGHGVHWRLQGYLTSAGVLLMKEVPLFNRKYNIQGHTDGLLQLSKIKKKIDILEIKSINTNEFKGLNQARKKDKAQAGTYMFCLEEHRKDLQKKYPTLDDLRDTEEYRREFYASLYDHLKDDEFLGGKTKAQKVAKKVKEHLKLDEILFSITTPINSMIILYEDKNTQELKDYVVERDDVLLQEVLHGFIKSNVYIKLGVVPPRECTHKNNQCDFCDICFK